MGIIIYQIASPHDIHPQKKNFPAPPPHYPPTTPRPHYPLCLIWIPPFFMHCLSSLTCHHPPVGNLPLLLDECKDLFWHCINTTSGVCCASLNLLLMTMTTSNCWLLVAKEEMFESTWWWQQQQWWQSMPMIGLRAQWQHWEWDKPNGIVKMEGQFEVVDDKGCSDSGGGSWPSNGVVLAASQEDHGWTMMMVTRRVSFTLRWFSSVF